MFISEMTPFKPQIPIGDAFMYAGIGLLAVFVVMILLIGIVYLFQLIFKYELIDKFTALFKGKDQEKNAIAIAVAGEESEESDEELAAVVMAAVYAMLESERGDEPVPPFTVRSIKRK